MEYYVYIHLRKDNNKVFYIGMGKGCRITHTTRNKPWNKVNNEAGGFNAFKLVDNLSKEEAVAIERDLISKVGLENLTNMHKGGQGGFENMTAEHRAKARRNRDDKAWRKAISEGHKKFIWTATKDGLTKEYTSLRETSNSLNFWYTPVHRHFKNKTSYYGYTFNRRLKQPSDAFA